MAEAQPALSLGDLAAMMPLLAMMLATLHHYIRQQEAAEAAQRENEIAQRHVA